MWTGLGPGRGLPTGRRVWQGAKLLVEKTVMEMSAVVIPAQQ